MSLHLNLSTGKFLNSSTLFKLSDALLLDVSSGEIVMSNLLVPRAGVDLFKLASLDLNFAQRKSLTDKVSGTNLVTFSRASSGTYVGSDGLIKTSVVNYAINSEQVDLWSLSNGSVSANFAESPIGDLTADKWIPNTASTFHFPKLVTTLSSSSSVTYSIYAKQVGYRYLLVNTTGGSASGNAGPVVDLQDGVVVDNQAATYPTTVTDAGNGWWRVALTFTGSGINAIKVDHNPLPTSTIAAYAGDGTSGVLLWGAQLEEGTTATDYIPTGATISGAPRFDHDPVTGESLGLLIEESRTNLVDYSEQLGNWVVPSTAISNTTTSPSGGTAVGLDGASAINITVTDPSSITFSCYVKAGSSDYVYLRTVNWGTLVRVWFNLADGSTGSVSPVSSNITNVTSTDAGDGWYRISFQLDSTGDNVGNLQITATDADLNINQVGYVFAWGIQVEEGSFPTSYIPTSGSTVTRSPDIATIEGTNFSSWYNQSEGTVFSDVSGLDADSGRAYVFSDGSIDARIGHTVTDSNGFNLFLRANSVTTSLAGNLSGLPKPLKAGIAYKSGSSSGVINGFLKASSTTIHVPNTINQLSLGSQNFSNDGYLNGHISRLAYFPTRKSDQDLIKITDGTLAPAIITYGITSAGGTFNLLSTGTVDYAVDWDSTGGYEESTSNTLPHTYTAGDYDLVVYSDEAYRPYFNNVTADASQITSVAIGSGADLGTSLANAWYGASNMTTFACPFSVTSLVTNFSQTWRSCRTLTSFPLIDTSSVTSFDTAWRDCTNLTSFPLIDTSSVTSFNNAWRDCTNLTSFPLIDTSSNTDFRGAWYNCTSLTSFPLLNTSSGTSFIQAWRGCSSLATFPLLNTSSGTNFGNAWYNCTSLTSFPLLNTSSGTNFGGAWYNCTNLTSFPLLNTSSGTSFSNAWRYCTSLTSFPLLDTSSGTNFNYTWNNCSSLTSFPANMFDTTGTLVANAFAFAWQLCALTAQSIENILVSLDTNGASNITLDIDGGSNAAKTTWSAAAVTAYDNLIVKGWTISFNA